MRWVLTTRKVLHYRKLVSPKGNRLTFRMRVDRGWRASSTRILGCSQKRSVRPSSRNSTRTIIRSVVSNPFRWISSNLITRTPIWDYCKRRRRDWLWWAVGCKSRRSLWIKTRWECRWMFASKTCWLRWIVWSTPSLVLLLSFSASWAERESRICSHRTNR